MSSDSTPTEQTAVQTPNAPPPGERGKQKRPVVWIVLAGVAIAAAIGLGVWAIVLNDDLNDTEAQLEAQTAAAESASAEAESRIADARASIDASLSGIAGIVVVSDEDVAEAEQAVADAEQSVAKPKRRLTRPKARSSRRRPNAIWPEPRLNKREPSRRRRNCARTPLSPLRRRCPRTTIRPQRMRRLQHAQRPLRAPAREGSSRHPTTSPSRSAPRWDLLSGGSRSASLGRMAELDEAASATTRLRENASPHRVDP